MPEIVGSMKLNEIPFMRAFPPTHTMPNGFTKVQAIPRPDAIYAAACEFIARDGRFLMAEVSPGQVQLIAAIAPAGKVVKVDEDMIMLAEENVADGPELPLAVDRLVKAALVALDAQQ